MNRSLWFAFVVSFISTPLFGQEPDERVRIAESRLTITSDLSEGAFSSLKTYRVSDRLILDALSEEDKALGGLEEVSRYIYAYQVLDEDLGLRIEAYLPIQSRYIGTNTQLVLPYVLRNPGSQEDNTEAQKYVIEYHVQKQGEQDRILFKAELSVLPPTTTSEIRSANIEDGETLKTDQVLSVAPEKEMFVHLELPSRSRPVEFRFPAGYTSLFRPYGEGEVTIQNLDTQEEIGTLKLEK
ncbi:MAG: hypothetical protein KDD62_05950 [Bdellovibrionales bacterium]|nr:hypothetical protein [Bdellovibrionales bacterium]